MEGKKILIIGPLRDFGGREIEVGFIAKTLSHKNEVFIYSTEFISSKSQIYKFIHRSRVDSFYNFLFKSFYNIKLSALLSYHLNKKRKEPSWYSKNNINKKFFNTEEKIKKLLKQLITQSDLIFLSSQLSTNYNQTIVDIAFAQQKPILFRTTGKFSQSDLNHRAWLSKVSMFIHHSNNSLEESLIMNGSKHKFIDQCAVFENDLLNIPLVKNKVKNFLTYGRLVKDKNIDVVIEAFILAKTSEDVLYVIGDGPELKNLKKIALNHSGIYFPGFITQENLKFFYDRVECVIIPRYEQETGPLTGIEAMASGKLLISSRTGAMPERLKDLGFWFHSSKEDIAEQISEVKKLNEFQAKEFSKKIRKKYNTHYRKAIIENKYLEVTELVYSINKRNQV